MYTITASLPFFSIIFFLRNYFDLRSFTPEFFNIRRGSTSLPIMIITLRFGMGLLVKLPLFIFHLWLPKAHVEAPVAGSIILAAILLKLGGFGLFRFRGVLVNSSSVISFIFATALVGGAWIRILCVRQVDIKVLIAYSSVAHIRFVAARIITFTSLGLWAAFRIIIAHAFSSSGIFLGANLLYLRSHSRLIFINKRVLKVLPAYSLFWFILAVANIGGPPTFNLFREIVNIVLLIRWRNLRLILICVIAGLAVAYTLILYSVSQHGFSSKLLKEWLPLTLLELKNLLAHRAFTVLAILVLPFLI